MRGFRHQHTSDLSASLTCSTMAFDIDNLESQVDAAKDATRGTHLSWEPKAQLARVWVKSARSSKQFWGLFRGARLLLFAGCSSIAGALFLMRPLLRCSPSELPGYEAQVTKAIASWFS